MNEKPQSSAKTSDQASRKASVEESTGYMSPGQLAMEEDLGLDVDVNLPATPRERQPRPHPDNAAVSSMQHPRHPHPTRTS